MIYAKYTVHRGEVATALKLINVFEGVIVSLTVVSISVQHMHLGMFLRVCSHHYILGHKGLSYLYFPLYVGIVCQTRELFGFSGSTSTT